MSTETRTESNGRTESNNSSKEAESSQEETGNQQNASQPSEVEKKLQDEKDKLESQLKDITVSQNVDIKVGPVRFNGVYRVFHPVWYSCVCLFVSFLVQMWD